MSSRIFGKARGKLGDGDVLGHQTDLAKGGVGILVH